MEKFSITVKVLDHTYAEIDEAIVSAFEKIGEKYHPVIYIDESKVLEMLEKSKAEKPHILDKDWNPIRQETIEWVCPNCKKRFMTYSRNKYCSECGQKLDWEDVTK